MPHWTMALLEMKYLLIISEVGILFNDVIVG